MPIQSFKNLESFGLNKHFQTHWEEYEQGFQKDNKPFSMKLGRVTQEDKNFFRVQGEESALMAELAGRFYFTTHNVFDLPKVGDWVAFAETGSQGRGIIHHVLNRQTMISRADQVLACNIDIGFITTSLNNDLNFNRIDRFLVLCRQSHIEPILVLTKCDLVNYEQLERIKMDLHVRYPLLRIIATSAQDGSNISELQECIMNHKTVVFLGTSGVGKSSLCNLILGTNLIETQEIRASDQKGRHTTTRRQMFQCPRVGILIDIPGVKTVDVGDSSESVQDEFAVIEQIARECKFSNCAHDGEPQCAIREALANGALCQAQYQNYIKLRNEAAFARGKQKLAERKQSRSQFRLDRNRKMKSLKDALRREQVE